MTPATRARARDSSYANLRNCSRTHAEPPSLSSFCLSAEVSRNSIRSVRPADGRPAPLRLPPRISFFSISISKIRATVELTVQSIPYAFARGVAQIFPRASGIGSCRMRGRQGVKPFAKIIHLRKYGGKLIGAFGICMGIETLITANLGNGLGKGIADHFIVQKVGDSTFDIVRNKSKTSRRTS